MAYSFLQAADSTANATTYTFSSQNLGAADSGRHIVVVAHSRATANNSISSITVGGVTATIVLDLNAWAGSTSNTTIAIAAVPSGTTGDVVVTYTGTMLRCGTELYRLTDIDSATPYDTASAEGTAASLNAAIDCAAGGCVVGGVTSSFTPNAISWANLTEDTDRQVEFIQAGSASDEFASAQAGLSVAATLTTSGLMSLVLASWSPAGGGGGAQTPAGSLGLLGVGI